MKMRHRRKRFSGYIGRTFKFWRELEEEFRHQGWLMSSRGLYVDRWAAGMRKIGDDWGTVTGRMSGSAPPYGTEELHPPVQALLDTDFSRIERRVLAQHWPHEVVMPGREFGRDEPYTDLSKVPWEELQPGDTVYASPSDHASWEGYPGNATD